VPAGGGSVAVTEQWDKYPGGGCRTDLSKNWRCPTRGTEADAVLNVK